MNNTSLYLKFSAAVLILMTMIALAFAKCFIKELDTVQINFVLLQVLTGLGIYHVTTSGSQPPKDQP